MPSLKRALGLAMLTAVVPAMSIPTPRAPVSLNIRAEQEWVEDPPCMGDNAKMITYFGERPSWRPDGKRLAFMSNSFGDAYEIDLMTGRIKLITDFPNPGYLRAQYLPNGGLFLIGAREFKDVVSTRAEDMEMFILQPGGYNKKPIPLEHKISEGVAISRHAERISWANTWEQYPDDFAKGESAIYVADIDYSSGKPVLTNKREVTRAMAPECTLEPQDFLKNDTELTYTCYIDDPDTDLGAVYGININTGKKALYRYVPGQYNEVEGIYPNEKYTLVESAWSNKTAESQSVNGIEIYRMSLEPNSTDWKRLTWFSQTKGWKAGNPVVSPDGLTMAVHNSRSDQQPGVGYGLYLVDLD